MNLKQLVEENNLKIVDAKRDLIVEVKNCDTKAARKAPQHCAFAQACKRQEKNIGAAVFLRSMAYIQRGDKLVRYRIPSSVSKEIVAFDRGGKLEPGEYYLRKITPSYTRTGYSKRKKAYKLGKRKRTVVGHHRTANIRTVNW